MTEKKYDIFIVDVYNMMYRATYGTKQEILVKEGTELYHIEGIVTFLEMIESYLSNYGKDDVTIYWLFDNAKSSIQKYRKSLNENYKKNRKEEPEWFYKSLDSLELVLHYYRDNSFIYRKQFIEADDYVNYIIDYSYNKDKDILLVSNDADWFRGLNTNVDQLYQHDIYDLVKFEEIFKYNPTYSNICFNKCFYGDTSDNITGFLPNLPHLFFKYIIDAYSTMDSFLFDVERGNINFLDLGWIEKIKKEANNLSLNWQLVTVLDLGDIDIKSSEVKCQFKEEKLKIIYQSLDLINRVDKRIRIKETVNNTLDSMFEGISLKR